MLSFKWQGLFCFFLLSLPHILGTSLVTFSVVVSVSCCSGLIEMVYNVATLSRQRDFSPLSFSFYSLIPAVLMPLDLSKETSGEING